MDLSSRETSFKDTGAVEQDRREQTTNVAPFNSQFDHRFQDPLNKANVSGMPGKGQTPEFTGEKEGRNELERDTNARLSNEVKRDETRIKKMDIVEGEDPEGELEDQDPGQRQRENQN